MPVFMTHASNTTSYYSTSHLPSWRHKELYSSQSNFAPICDPHHLKVLSPDGFQNILKHANNENSLFSKPTVLKALTDATTPELYIPHETANPTAISIEVPRQQTQTHRGEDIPEKIKQNPHPW